MRIMLACNAGMSTSLVVAKMQDAAKAHGKDYKIWAVEQGEIQNELGNFDVLLLGPQVRHILRRVTKLWWM
jgi:PTS system cellobiose-specific IIB component